jgi:hypothetical protein
MAHCIQGLAEDEDAEKKDPAGHGVHDEAPAPE